jgi:hypothetical protein
MQVRLFDLFHLPIDLASNFTARTALVANEGWGVFRDIVIMGEGFLTWIIALGGFGGREVTPADNVSDPLAKPWDDVVRAPRTPGHHARRSDVSGHHQPAA